jgi:hypothetical protein
MWYAGYAKSGHEFRVEQELTDMGITSWVARKMDFKQVGKKRDLTAVISPHLPYPFIFINVDVERYIELSGVKSLASTLVAIPGKSVRDLERFRKEVEAAYEAKKAILESGQRLSMFTEGERLEIISGPLAGQLATFRKIVDQAGIMHRSLRVSVDFMAKGIDATLDPLDVRKVG